MEHLQLPLRVVAQRMNVGLSKKGNDDKSLVGFRFLHPLHNRAPRVVFFRPVPQVCAKFYPLRICVIKRFENTVAI